MPLPQPDAARAARFRLPLRRAALPLAMAALLAGCMGDDGLDTGSLQAVSTSVSAPARGAAATPVGLWQGGATLLVVTTRDRTSPAAEPWFGTGRAADPTAARAVLYPPGRTMLASLDPLASDDWSVAGVQPLAGGTPAPQAVATAAEGRDVLLYVHGFNETFDSAATSYAKLVQGLGFSGAPILFTWPSRGALLDYAYDRESAMGSRDALEDTITALAKDPHVGRINILAHSMGGLLTLESLRSFVDRTGSSLAGRIGAIVLANPDVDVDLFRHQVGRMAPLVPKMTVIISGNDRALELSSKLAGGVARVGMADRTALDQTGVKVVDASDFGSGLINHDIFMSRPELRGVIQRALDSADQ